MSADRAAEVDRPISPDQPPAKQPARAEERSWATRFRPALKVAPWLAVIAAVLGLSGYIILSRTERAEVTRGVILVETPQVYTRERLVNDRFVQDGWLRNVLREEAKFSVTETVSTSVGQRTILQMGGSGGAGEPEQATRAKPAGAEDRPATERQLDLPPSLSFLMRNSFRELVRAHLIENQLDDRHDIRGTTLYLFKFDASILPGDNTRRPAFVRVHVKNFDPAPAGSKVGTEKYIEQYVSLLNVERSSAAENYKLYEEWTKSLQERLNYVFADVLRRFNSDDFRLAEYSNFLDLLGERAAGELFHSSASVLMTLDEQRDALQSDRKKGVANKAASDKVTADKTLADKTLADKTPPPRAASRDAEISGRFHFLAKYILSTAAAGQRPDLGKADRLRDLLNGDEPLPSAPEAEHLRKALLSYAIRRVGRYVVGDTSFSLGELQNQTAINSKSLDPFVEIWLLQRGERGLYQIAVFPRSTALVALGLAPDSRDDNSCAAENWSSAQTYFLPVTSYLDQQGSRVQVVHPVPLAAAKRAGELVALIPSEFLNSPHLGRAFQKSSGGGPDARYLVPGRERCFSLAESRLLPTGYFAFVYGIREMQTYTYATFPRLDVQVSDVSDDVAQEDRLSGDLPGGKARGTLANDYQRMVRGVQPKTAVVGFSGYCTFREPARQPPAPATYWMWRSTAPSTGPEFRFLRRRPRRRRRVEVRLDHFAAARSQGRGKRAVLPPDAADPTLAVLADHGPVLVAKRFGICRDRLGQRAGALRGDQQHVLSGHPADRLQVFGYDRDRPGAPRQP